MQTSSLDTRALAQSAFDALRRGDARGARATFERLAAAGAGSAANDFGLAHACRQLGDNAAALAALDRALAVEPRNVRALILKADCLADIGDARAASSFYSYAIQAVPPDAQIPTDLRAELARAQAMCERYAAQFERFLVERLAADGAIAAPSARRFRQSLDILLGKKQIYFQQPNTYYFPELPQVQFYDRERFPWLDKLEAATAEIRAELMQVLDEHAAFVPYIQGDPRRPRKEETGLQDNLDWSAFYFWKDGELVAENAARCPRTMAALENIALTRVKNRSPSVLFSQLRAGAHIPPHCGLVNTRLICHLPLIVPKGCAFRVGNDTREPVEGKAWVFDDTIEHEAWNRSSSTRVILLFEIWRPELSDDERALVAGMFEAIDAYAGRKPAWSI
jgi:aspartyl/asparaginyl beta-hydroxylase (cupin superfamily)